MRTRFGVGSLLGGLLIGTLMAAPLAGQTAKAVRLSSQEVFALLQNAKVPADHQKLAAHYEQTAADLDEKVAEHGKLAAIYRRLPAPGNPKVQLPNYPVLASHCDRIAASAATGAAEARTMAEHHRMVAKSMAK